MGLVVSVLAYVGQAGCSMLLGCLGFSASGPVAGSLAAGWMAATGGVAAGSFYAFFQSLAMGGVAAPVLASIGGIGVGALAWGASKLASTLW